MIQPESPIQMPGWPPAGQQLSLQLLWGGDLCGQQAVLIGAWTRGSHEYQGRAVWVWE